MSSTVMFTAFDVRPYSSMSEKQKEHFKASGIVPTKFKDLSKKQLEYCNAQDNYKPFMNKDNEFIPVFKFSINTSFLEKCPDPENHSTEDLFNKFQIAEYVSNETGPALVNLVHNHEEFFINGKQVDAEMAKKMMHNTKFVEKFDKLISQ